MYFIVLGGESVSTNKIGCPGTGALNLYSVVIDMQYTDNNAMLTTIRSSACKKLHNSTDDISAITYTSMAIN